MKAPSNTKIKTIARKLAGGQPMSFKLYDDLTLVIIGPDGKKSKHAYEAYKHLLTPKKPASKPKKPASKQKK